MANLSGPRCKRNRRCRTDLLVTSGIRDKKHREGVPGGRIAKRPSDYGMQLQMKQTIRYYYGVMEKQFYRYYELADRQKGATGFNILMLLESRLDNIVYRMGYACTRQDARQLVSHGHVLVNGKKVDRPSYLLKTGDQIQINEASLKLERVQFAIKLYKQRVDTEWLEVDHSKGSGTFMSLPTIDQLPVEFNVSINLSFSKYSGK